MASASQPVGVLIGQFLGRLAGQTAGVRECVHVSDPRTHAVAMPCKRGSVGGEPVWVVRLGNKKSSPGLPWPIGRFGLLVTASVHMVIRELILRRKERLSDQSTGCR